MSDMNFTDLTKFTNKGKIGTDRRGYVIDEKGGMVRVGRIISGNTWEYTPWMLYQDLFKLMLNNEYLSQDWQVV